MEEKRSRITHCANDHNIDELLATRLTNDERMLRRLARRFNHLSILARKLPPPPPVDPSSNAPSATEAASKEVQDAREAFLADLDLFQTTLIKNRQICQAEGRMVDHYEKEKQRVGGCTSPLSGFF